MRQIERVLLVCTVLLASGLLLNAGLEAQTDNSVPTSVARPKSQAATGASDVEQLKQQVQEQQKQLEALRATLQKQQDLLKQLALKKQAPSASERREPVGSKASGAQVAPATQSRNISDASGPAPALADASMPAEVGPSARSYDSDQQMNPAVPNSPIAPIPLHIGRAELTPVGFVDATDFWRSKNLGAIGASFGSLPFSNTTAGHLTENRLSIQNSRLGIMLDSQFGQNKVRGYLESDFLGAQPSNAFVESNSDSLRIRLYWVDVQRGKFEFLAGQSWSLLVPSRVGISPMPSSLFYTQDMDTNYQVGLTWTRQLQFRFTYHATPNVTAALSIENAEQYPGGAVTFPSGFNTSQVDTGSSTTTPNLVPDIIGKIAFDGHVGDKLMHLEFAGLLRAFKVVNPTLTSTSTAVGGGGSVNFNLELVKNFHLIVSSFYSDGGARYINGLGPDFIVRPDFTISPVQADSGIGGFEYHVTPKTLIYSYYGGAYLARNFGVVPPTSPGGAVTYVGYGYPGSSSSANKSIQEGTFGVIQTFWKNAHYGALQLITQYSYLTRAPWFVASGSPKNANLSEAYVDLRYVLP